MTIIGLDEYMVPTSLLHPGIWWMPWCPIARSLSAVFGNMLSLTPPAVLASQVPRSIPVLPTLLSLCRLFIVADMIQR